ncbi:MAG: radical SAM protein [Proteobacteria bacterium]|jgi:sulfatase maturation enzyme AslB (radical SAM superfamily)|nr:radical SAM protein [Pseudomonadota bacterium]
MDKHIKNIRKFSDPNFTVDGKNRAHVSLKSLDTLWFNTGTLCNLECVNCYIESSPKNDELSYISLIEVTEYLDEIQDNNLTVKEIGLTGGEPFMNPDIIKIIECCLARGFKLLVLTNAMRPMMRHKDSLLTIKNMFPELLTIRVSIDHFTKEGHQTERGLRSWDPMIKGLRWLSENGFRVDVAGRTFSGQDEHTLRHGYKVLFEESAIKINATDQRELILFPEMDQNKDVVEITTDCWNILNVNPDSMMCASSRMVVKHKGSDAPVVMACTLLAYDQQFKMGSKLMSSRRDVSLNHPFCSTFCVLGGASCSK